MTVATAERPAKTRTRKPGANDSTARTQPTAAQRFKQAQRAAILIKQVSDPTRLQVVMMLANGEMHVQSLCDELSLGQPVVSHHLALLRHGSTIVPRRQGKHNYYGLTETGEELARLVKGIIPPT